MMKCESLAFDELLDAEDGIDTRDPDIARHLENCTHGQSRLDVLAADAEQWDETRHWLSTGDVNDPMCAEEWKQVRDVADSTAQQWKHNCIGSEHLLMGLIAEGTTVNQFLREQGIEPAAVRDMVLSIHFSPPGRQAQPLRQLSR